MVYSGSGLLEVSGDNIGDIGNSNGTVCNSK